MNPIIKKICIMNRNFHRYIPNVCYGIGKHGPHGILALGEIKESRMEIKDSAFNLTTSPIMINGVPSYRIDVEYPDTLPWGDYTEEGREKLYTPMTLKQIASKRLFSELVNPEQMNLIQIITFMVAGFGIGSLILEVINIVAKALSNGVS